MSSQGYAVIENQGQVYKNFQTSLEEHGQSSFKHTHPRLQISGGGMRRSASTASIESFSSLSGGKLCCCAPTKHAGSFRCRLHRNPQQPAPLPSPSSTQAVDHSKTSDSLKL